MSKEFVASRKVSAIVALALAMVVSFAAINSYGDSKPEEAVACNMEGSLELAYVDLIDESYIIEFEEVETEIINIYNTKDELVKSFTVSSEEMIKNEEDRQLMNRAEFMSAYGKTSVYKISD